ncbi:DUF7024 domain-containing protein (plasmid) [Aureimonas ureilytica]|uniref:DUF7024 domain-containing protein n=1 Tax=Aureimonas ureilytica TaxID=401562 RepID=UPI003CF768E0
MRPPAHPRRGWLPGRRHPARPHRADGVRQGQWRRGDGPPPVRTRRAFGPNVGADVEVVAGDARATFRLTSDLSEVSVTLDPGVAINGLSLRVPHAVSPAELGINGDIRRLGIGVAWFEITPLQP